MTSGPIRWRMSRLHPHALTLDDEPLIKGEVTADALHAHIDALQTPPIIQHLRCIAPFDMESGVLTAAGFQQVGLTKIIRIQLPINFTVPETDLKMQWNGPKDGADWPVWYAAHWDSYRRTHVTNPAQDLGADQYPDLFGDDLIDALFAYRGDMLVGFGSLRPDQELGWIDVTSPSASDFQAVLARHAASCDSGWLGVRRARSGR
ncbi:MAG: hypothetical protein AAFQ64_08870 [Pseudomonadota bacterium]